MDLLHDDAIVALGEYACKLFGAEAYVRLAQTNRRARQLLLPEDDGDRDGDGASAPPNAAAGAAKNTHRASIIRQAVRTRVACLPLGPLLAQCNKEDWMDCVRTLPQLATFERWRATSLSDDNRIPFPLGSTEITERMLDKINATREILDRYPEVSVRLDVHCGTIAPPGVAGWFSAERGRVVQRAMCSPRDLRTSFRRRSLGTGEERESTIDTRRIQVFPHGRKIALVVSRWEDHPFAALAQEGRGWVEVYVEVPGSDLGSEDDVLFLPPHPEYYSMARPPTLEETLEDLMEEEEDRRVRLPAGLVWDNAWDEGTEDEGGVESGTDSSDDDGSG
ncbi:hypothetical protein ACHAWF_009298 [Thalassiosira exigua]